MVVLVIILMQWIQNGKDICYSFHQNWNISSDTVTPHVKFNIFSKQRGVAKGCDLTAMSHAEIAEIKVTKTLIARLLGQLYDLSGLLAPIRATLLSLFSKTCALLSDWSSSLPPGDETVAMVISVLTELAVDLPNINPILRCKVPYNSILQRIVIFSDASLDVVAYVI